MPRVQRYETINRTQFLLFLSLLNVKTLQFPLNQPLLRFYCSQCLSSCPCKALTCSYMLPLKQSHSEFKHRQRAPQKASAVGTPTLKLFSAAGSAPLWNVIKTFLRLEALALSADWIKVWLLPCVDVWMLMSRLCLSRPWVMVEKGDGRFLRRMSRLTGTNRRSEPSENPN